MNYISHYYLFKEISNPEMTLGLVLPDFTRAVDKKFRLKKIKNIDKADHFYDLKYGINQHLETDIIFHAAPFFKIHVAKLKAQIIELQLIENNKYAFFLAHIAFEMILDRCLIKKDAKAAQDFYTLIKQVDLELIKVFLKENNFTQHTSKLNEFMHNFNTKKYILAYVEDTKMAYALGRVFSYATKTNQDWTTNQKMKIFINSSEKYLNNYLDEIFEYMSQRISF